MISTIRGEKESIASTKRKGKHGRKPDFSLVVQLGKGEHEIFYFETGTPNSSINKQIQDHRKLIRFCKDSIDRTKNNYSLKQIFKNSVLKTFTTIFTMNVTGMCNFISLFIYLLYIINFINYNGL